MKVGVENADWNKDLDLQLVREPLEDPAELERLT